MYNVCVDNTFDYNSSSAISPDVHYRAQSRAYNADVVTFELFNVRLRVAHDDPRKRNSTVTPPRSAREKACLRAVYKKGGVLAGERFTVLSKDLHFTKTVFQVNNNCI